MSSLARGDALPHFVVTTTSGERVEYKTIWQHRMAVLLVLPREPGRLGAYADDLLRRCAEAAPEAACIATRDIVPGLPAPALVVTDQWGEIDTLGGRMRVSPGDYIIRGVKGELYLCKPDIFEATYEPMEETPK